MLFKVIVCVNASLLWLNILQFGEGPCADNLFWRGLVVRFKKGEILKLN